MRYYARMALETQSGQLRSTSARQAASTVSANLLAPNSERSGLQVTATADDTYLKLYTGADGSTANAPAVTTGAATNADIFVPAKGSWPGTIGGVVWTGGVACISAVATGAILALET